MPHGRPDWYNIAPLVQIHASEDINELAARLDNINVFDRRGNVVDTETFAYGLGGCYVVAGGEASYELSCAYSRSDGLSLKCLTTGSDFDSVTIDKYQGVQGSGSRGLEVSWSATAKHGQIGIALWYHTGTLYYWAQVYYDFDTETLYYLDDAGVGQEIDNALLLSAGGSVWHYLKLAVDWDAKEYLRVLIDGHSYSLAGITIYDGIGTTNFSENWRLYVVGEGHVESDFYIDSMIYTINEN